MKRFVLTKAAERDLDQIKSFLGEQAGPKTTRRVLKEIRRALELLGNEPGVGHFRQDLTSRPLKFWPNLLLSDRLLSRDKACSNHSRVAQQPERRGDSKLKAFQGTRRVRARRR